MSINMDLEPVKSKERKSRPRINKMSSLVDRKGTIKIMKDQGNEAHSPDFPSPTELGVLVHPTKLVVQSKPRTLNQNT